MDSMQPIKLVKIDSSKLIQPYSTHRRFNKLNIQNSQDTTPQSRQSPSTNSKTSGFRINTVTRQPSLKPPAIEKGIYVEKMLQKKLELNFNSSQLNVFSDYQQSPTLYSNYSPWCSQRTLETQVIESESPSSSPIAKRKLLPSIRTTYKKKAEIFLKSQSPKKQVFRPLIEHIQKNQTEISSDLDKSEISVVWKDSEELKEEMDEYIKSANPIESWAALYKYRYENYPEIKDKLTKELFQKFINTFGKQAKQKWKKYIKFYKVEFDEIRDFNIPDELLQIGKRGTRSLGRIDSQISTIK